MDRISSLPDGVITHILSFLPIQEAATTSVLSKRWRILFAFSPNLDFGYWTNLQSYMDFVDRVLSVSENSPIKKFSVSCSEGLEPARIIRWLCDVLNRGVLELDIVDGVDKDEGVYIRDENSLPFVIFTCKTLVKLELSGFLINELPEDTFLPALKALFLEDVWFCSLKVCAFRKLLSASPVLKELSIKGKKWEFWKWSRAITSRSLQKLTIAREEFNDFDGSDFGRITFDTPSLAYFNYSDFIPGSYPVVNLRSLVRADLNLVVTVDNTWEVEFVDEDDNITSNPSNLITGLRNVEIMNLLSLESLEMFYLFRRAIPVFKYLFHLSITSSSRDSLRGLPFLLKKAPDLETLIINGYLNQSGYGSSWYSCLLSCPVLTLKIFFYSGTTAEVEHLKHFLGKLSCLELLEVKIWGTEDIDKFQIAKDLLMLPRASSKCKIKVI